MIRKCSLEVRLATKTIIWKDTALRAQFPKPLQSALTTSKLHPTKEWESCNRIWARFRSNYSKMIFLISQISNRMLPSSLRLALQQEARFFTSLLSIPVCKFRRTFLTLICHHKQEVAVYCLLTHKLKFRFKPRFPSSLISKIFQATAYCLSLLFRIPRSLWTSTARYSKKTAICTLFRSVTRYPATHGPQEPSKKLRSWRKSRL